MHPMIDMRSLPLFHQLLLQLRDFQLDLALAVVIQDPLVRLMLSRARLPVRLAVIHPVGGPRAQVELVVRDISARARPSWGEDANAVIHGKRIGAM